MATDQTTRDKIVLLLTNGMSIDAAEAFCLRGGMEPAEARQTVAEARKRITLAAEFARDEQLGRAIMRLDDLYAKSIAGQDIRTALQAQRELNRLLRLYDASLDDSPGGASGDESASGLELIASYLLPLKLTDERYPVEEHARVAAEILRSTRGVPAS